ncbi:hypothetical protein ATE67_00080 [Sphingopyxis sp. H050]|jgi:hypothetical protein|uniref:hypothetical protein n=1 Tax=Sphingopyxis sp. H050 TaxID=1759072 RepID=UPI0007378217|nr:hypothetical protein [Sphingopyxis sp. H050]KTE22394.1 hypothetical protein ATE67_00080 [Sphingopyxis sp. H050]
MADDSRNTENLPPEAINREQEDEEAQAHSVAEDARRERPLGESRKPKARYEDDDTEDLVDHMRQMERSGRIDMDAYRGERSDDDEDDQLGEGGIEDGGPRGAP